MKRIATVLVAGLLAASTLNACGGSTTKNDHSGGSAPSTTSPSSPSRGTGTTTSSSNGNGNSNSANYCASLQGARGKLARFTTASRANFRRIVAVVQQVADQAPSRLSADWKVLIGFLSHPRSMRRADVRKLRKAGTAIAQDAKARCSLGVQLGP